MTRCTLNGHNPCRNPLDRWCSRTLVLVYTNSKISVSNLLCLSTNWISDNIELANFGESTLPLDLEFVLKLENGPVLSPVFMFFESSSEEVFGCLGTWKGVKESWNIVNISLRKSSKAITHSSVHWRIVVSMWSWFCGCFSFIAGCAIHREHVVLFMLRRRRLRLTVCNCLFMGKSGAS